MIEVIGVHDYELSSVPARRDVQALPWWQRFEFLAKPASDSNYLDWSREEEGFEFGERHTPSLNLTRNTLLGGLSRLSRIRGR